VLLSPPRVRRRVGDPAEACDERGSAEAFGGGSPEASGEGASSDTENWPRPLVRGRLRPAMRGPRASRRVGQGQRLLAGFDLYEV